MAKANEDMPLYIYEIAVQGQDSIFWQEVPACYFTSEDNLVVFKGKAHDQVFAIHRERLVTATRRAVYEASRNPTVDRSVVKSVVAEMAQTASRVKSGGSDARH